MLQALQLTPSSQSLLRQTLLLASSGNPLKPGDLAPSIDALLSQEQRSPSDELLLCQALAAAERVEEAIQRLQQLPDPDVSQTALLARLYLTAGKADQGQQLLQQMNDNYQVRQSQLTTLERIDYADVLLLQEQPKAAMDLLKSALLAISERASHLKRQGHQVLNLSVGEPDLPVPDWVRQRAIQASWPRSGAMKMQRYPR
jgi:thioredoxin-like negative regulator of GroEL